jgi:nucleotidyltransferase/DNA polymerase involved in DNA repair
VKEAKQLCPGLIPVEAKHKLYTLYHQRVLDAVECCVPIEKGLSIDEMACRLMGPERKIPVARELATKIKRALRERVGECLTCSIGLAPSIFLGKVASDIQKPDGLVVITKDNLPDILLHLELQEILGIGPRMEQRLNRAGIFTVADLWNASSLRLRQISRQQRIRPVGRIHAGEVNRHVRFRQFHQPTAHFRRGVLVCRIPPASASIPACRPISCSSKNARASAAVNKAGTAFE